MSWKDHLRETIPALHAYRPFDYATAPADVVRLDANESPFPLEPGERAALGEVLARVEMHRYPEVSGRPLREALARRWGVDPAQIVVGNGSDEIISILFTAFGGGRGGARAKVLFPTPTFGEFEAIALAHGAEPVPVPLDARFQLDEARLAEAVRAQRPALAFFASPNNPTGNRFDAAVVERLAGIGDGLFVSDEAYADFTGGTMLPLVGRIPGFCVMRTLSKIGFAALRVGALVAPPEIAAELDKVRLPYNVNAVSQAIACWALSQPGWLETRIAHIAVSLRELDRGLRRLPGLEVFPSDANFVLVRTRATPAPALWEKLLAKGVLVRNLSKPGPLENCLRITAGTPEENQRCLEALRALLP
jgi:histidinol-phosphate aminotransferase